MANKDFYDTLAYTSRQIDFVNNLFDAWYYKIPEEYCSTCNTNVYESGAYLNFINERRINNMNNAFSSNQITPKKIIYSGNKTIVIWGDGVKTIVSLAEGDQYDPYLGFCAALAKRVYGSTSAAKRIIDKKASINKKTKRFEHDFFKSSLDARQAFDELSKKVRDVIGALNKNWRTNENE